MVNLEHYLLIKLDRNRLLKAVTPVATFFDFVPAAVDNGIQFFEEVIHELLSLLWC
ncbi:hypothetical protein D3C84_1128740 [compost metagenome]